MGTANKAPSALSLSLYLGSCLFCTSPFLSLSLAAPLSLSAFGFFPLWWGRKNKIFASPSPQMAGGLLPSMASYWDVPLQEGELPAACPPEKCAASTGSKFEELFPGDTNMEGEDASQEWLSIFLEDCLSNTTCCITTSPTPTLPNQRASISLSSNPRQPNSQNPKSSLELGLVFPIKASRTKRRRVTPGTAHPFANHSSHVTPPPDLPLLPQDCWLAESELIILKKEEVEEPAEATMVAASTAVPVEGWRQGRKKVGEKDGALTQPRKCSHCLSQKTPQWRAGPLGPKTLCNACGVRYKSGRLLPEYRPAKSPTFVSCKHSNSHKKVLEMRMNILPSSSN